MTNLQVKDGAGNVKYLSANGAGSDADPHIVEHRDGGPFWITSHTVTRSADASGTIDVTAAPTAGQKIVITDIVLSSTVTMSVTLLEETSGTVIGGPYDISAYAPLPLSPRSKWKLATADKKLQADASVAGNLTVEVWYYSEA